ncbi:MAG TPA: hypothetical protein VM695_15075 [Phycisphaerae bacterium]|nr:hypothetical protein [Phycisphaerae bacterium]
MEKQEWFGVVVCAVLLLASTPAVATGVFSDEFEDNSIDSTRWVYGGATRAWNPAQPTGLGNWTFWHTETVWNAGDPDGYLQAGVSGPTSGNTYGAEAWIRTAYDYNDGMNHLINLTWEAEVVDNHYNRYYLQLTDGYVADPGSLHWSMAPPPGTTNFLCETNAAGNTVAGMAMYTGLPKSSWSLVIGASGIGRLFDGPDGTGSLIHEATLDMADPWYFRLMVSDGTSAGFPAGEAHLNVYSMSSLVSSGAIPEPLTALGALGAIAALPGYCRRRIRI